METICVPGSEIFSGAMHSKDGYHWIFRGPENEFRVPSHMGQGYALHYHDFYEMIFVLKGSGTFQTPEGICDVRRGDVVLNNLFVPHAILADPVEGYERFSLCMDPSLLLSFCSSDVNLLDIFTPNEGRSPVLHLTENQYEKCSRVIEQFRLSRQQHGQQLLERALAQQLLAYLYEMCYVGLRMDGREAQQVATVARVMEYINGHLSEELPLERLAQEANYSVYHTCKLFKRLTGRTLTSYILEKRMEGAARAILEGEPITSAAQSVGFHNYSYFYKAFRKTMGLGPAEFRDRSLAVKL